MKKNEGIRRVIHPQVKVIDAAGGLVEYVASDETVDWYDEVIRAEGWRFTHFRNNAPFVDSHDYGTIEKLLGRVVSAEVRERQLVERVQWAIDVPENELARIGFAMTAGGYLRAVSVGFVAVTSVRRGEKEFEAELAKVGGIEAQDRDRVYRIFTAQEQLELSSCILGANPSALVKAWEAGDVAEDSLARIGFDGDGEMEFLTKAAAAVETGAADAVMRSMIAIEMGRIYAGRKTLSGPGNTTTGTSPSTRSAGEEAERSAVARAAILMKLAAMAAANNTN